MQRFRINLLFSILILVWLGGQTSAQEIHYYTILGCHDCEEIQEEVLEPLVRDFQEGGTDLQLVIHDILNAQEFEDMQSEMSRLGLRYEGTPFVIIADQYFIGNDLNAQKLSQNLRMLGEGQTSGEVSPQATEGQTSNPESPSSTKGTDHDFSLIAVLAAGLIDGINPCALMTLLFLISLLAVGGQSKRIIFLVGLGFTLGVFGTYLAIGIGLLRTADALGWPSWLGDSLKYAMSGVLLLFVFLSLRDFFKLRAGKSEEVALAMPEGLKKLSKKLMRKSPPGGLWFFGGPGFGGAAEFAGVRLHRSGLPPNPHVPLSGGPRRLFWAPFGLQRVIYPAFGAGFCAFIGGSGAAGHRGLDAEAPASDQAAAGRALPGLSCFDLCDLKGKVLGTDLESSRQLTTMR
jgi:cytochrome c biogenesis protein CcdA